MVRQVNDYISIPLIVGGGLTTPRQVAAAAEAGADYVVVGSALEFNPTTGFIKEMAAAAQPAATKTERDDG